MMDFNLKQWRNQHESDQARQQHGGNQSAPAKIPKFLKLDPSSYSSSSALSLFVPEQQQPQPSSTKLSAFPDISATTTSPKFPSRMGSFFSLAQWQELELQALIFRYFSAGASVPAELLVPIQKSLVSSSSYIPHLHPLHHYAHYQQSLLQSGYWGRAAMDPEPGRCRRTDGKKWRCSRDVVIGHKYCERHMHRGRNRSRKPVEIPAHPTTNPFGTSSIGVGGEALKSSSSCSASPYRVPGGSGTSPAIDILSLNQRSSNSISENRNLLGVSMNEKIAADDQEGSDGHVLRHFFDDWPRSLQELENSSSNADPLASSTSLSMSIPGNQASDVSLKLSTGSGEPPSAQESSRGERERMQLSWMTQWGQHQAGPMGGPLAEALRSSATTNSSPTSVLHEVPRSTTSETSLLST